MKKRGNLSQLLSIILAVTAVMISVSACSKSGGKNDAAQQQIITVKAQNSVSTLTYSGVIAPISIHPVISPVDGTVKEMRFNYGEAVDKGALLFTLKSSSLDKDYQQTLSTFLTSKEKYATNKQTVASSENLYNAGIISQQQYQSAQSSYYDSYLSYLQSQYALLEMLKQVDISGEDIEQQNIENFDFVKQALTQSIGNINITAPARGIALRPLKGSPGSDDASPLVQVGSQIKTGQMLVALGDMSGILININVDEISINSISAGEKAIVTSAAFPGITLQGEVTSVSSQANTQDGGGLPTFPIQVAVKNLTPQQKKSIHVGMSAKVQLVIEKPDVILIPIQAVFQQNGANFVNVKNPETGKITAAAVKTGETSIDQVSILEGLKPGDQIVVRH